MSNYLVWEYSIVEENGEQKETVGAYKYEAEKDALKAYHQKLAGACSNSKYIKESVYLTDANGHTIMTESLGKNILNPEE